MNEVSIEIAAPAGTVWRELTDVERWPEWTASVSKVDKLDDGDLAPGHRVRLDQPKMPTMVWTVGSLHPGRGFAWSTKAGGVTTEASHELSSEPEGGVVVTLAVRQRGLLAPVIRLLTRRRTQRYIEMEANGLKEVSEARSRRR